MRTIFLEGNVKVRARDGLGDSNSLERKNPLHYILHLLSFLFQLLQLQLQLSQPVSNIKRKWRGAESENKYFKPIRPSARETK